MHLSVLSLDCRLSRSQRLCYSRNGKKEEFVHPPERRFVWMLRRPVVNLVHESHHRRYHLVVRSSQPPFATDGKELHALGKDSRHMTEGRAAHQEPVSLDHARHVILDVETDMQAQIFALNTIYSRSDWIARRRSLAVLRAFNTLVNLPRFRLKSADVFR